MARRLRGIRSRITLIAVLVAVGILAATGLAVVSAMYDLLVDDLAAADDDARGEVVETTVELAVVLAVALPVVASALAVLVWWLVGRTLRPVEAIRAEVAAIGDGDLHRRVPAAGTGDEIDRLAATMNAMLARLEEGRERQVRLVADASHELRTPVARMLTQLEVDAAHPTTADPVASGERLLDDLRGLQALVDDLLLLARADAEDGVPAAARVDLDDVVLEEVACVPPQPGVRIDTADVRSVRVRGDRSALGRVVRNLVDNAVRHAHSTVTVGLGTGDDDGTAVAVLTVDDDGPGIPLAAREAVFERFSRLDGARGGPAGGTGLGLAIVRDVVTRHGGRAVVDDPPGTPGTRFRVVLLQADRDPPHQTPTSDLQRETSRT